MKERERERIGTCLNCCGTCYKLTEAFFHLSPVAFPKLSPTISVTRLGDFLKFFVRKYVEKVAILYGYFLGLSEKHHF